MLGWSSEPLPENWPVAGTTGYDYATITMPADVTSQSRNCFKTIQAALQEGSFALTDIVRATYYVTDVKDADALFAVTGEFLGEIRPAATMVEVSALIAPNLLVEIEADAYVVESPAGGNVPSGPGA